MRRLSLVASAIAVATGIVYIGLLIRQGTPVEPFTVIVVTGAIAAIAALAAYGSRGRDPARRALALWAAVLGFFGIGYLAAWSIGGLLLIGGVLTLPAAIGALRGIRLGPRATLGWALILVLAWAAVVGALLVASWRAAS